MKIDLRKIYLQETKENTKEVQKDTGVISTVDV